MKVWTEKEKLELSELFHLAHAYLGNGRYTRHDRKLWASRKYSELHPEVSSTAAYKQLCREEAWRFADPVTDKDLVWTTKGKVLS